MRHNMCWIVPVVIIVGANVLSSQVGISLGFLIWPAIAFGLAYYFYKGGSVWLSLLFVGLAIIHLARHLEGMFFVLVFSVIVAAAVIAGGMLIYSRRNPVVDIDRDLPGGRTEEEEKPADSDYSRPMREKNMLIGEIKWTKIPYKLPPTAIQFFIGEVTIDLAKAESNERDVHLHIKGGVGGIKIFLPDTWDADVQTKIGIGEVNMLKQKEGGMFSNAHFEHKTPVDPEHKLYLQADIGVGEIVIKKSRW